MTDLSMFYGAYYDAVIEAATTDPTASKEDWKEISRVGVLQADNFHTIPEAYWDTYVNSVDQAHDVRLGISYGCGSIAL